MLQCTLEEKKCDSTCCTTPVSGLRMVETVGTWANKAHSSAWRM